MRDSSRLCAATAHRRTHQEVCREHECLSGGSCGRMRALGLADDGSPLPRHQRPLCGARTRAGSPCRMRVEPGKRRCRLHGGMSTGPRSAEGRAKIAEAQRKRWRQAERHSLPVAIRERLVGRTREQKLAPIGHGNSTPACAEDVESGHPIARHAD